MGSSVDFKYIGNLDSLGTASEAMKRGQCIKRTSDGTGWEGCDDAERASGFSYHEVRLLSTGYNIYTSSYDEGLSSDFYGRRNHNKPFLANVGDPIGVAIGAGVVIEGYDLYYGTVAPEELLIAGVSGLLRKAANSTEEAKACARVQVGGTSTDGDLIKIITLG